MIELQYILFFGGANHLGFRFKLVTYKFKSLVFGAEKLCKKTYIGIKGNHF